VLDIIIY